MTTLWTLFDVYKHSLDYLDLDSDYWRSKHFDGKTDSGNFNDFKL